MPSAIANLHALHIERMHVDVELACLHFSHLIHDCRKVALPQRGFYLHETDD
jgi:hypothetical protein